MITSRTFVFEEPVSDKPDSKVVSQGCFVHNRTDNNFRTRIGKLFLMNQYLQS